MVIGEGTGSYIFIPEKSSIPVNSACVISICVCLTESKRLHICQFYQVVGTQANSSKLPNYDLLGSVISNTMLWTVRML